MFRSSGLLNCLMRMHWSYRRIAIIFILAWAGAQTEKGLDNVKQKWSECCEKYTCIENSCYIVQHRASSWAAVRQRCQGLYPDWPSLVDLFQIRNEDNLKAFSEMIQEDDIEFTTSRKVWTSGIRCPKYIPKGEPVQVTRWILSDHPLPEWIEDKLVVNYEKLEEDNGCKFLVLSPASNISETTYEFQDQSSSNAGICEFVFPGEVETTIPTEESTVTTYETTSDLLKEASTTPLSEFMSETEHFTEETTIKTKSRTSDSSKELENNSSEEVTVTLTNTSLYTETTISPTVRTKSSSATPILHTQSSISPTETSVSPTEVSVSKTETSTFSTETTSTSTMVTIASRFCKGKKVADIEWPDTLAGTTANERCPEGMTGYAQWTCDESTLQFTPEKPHIQDCKHIWIKELEDNVEDGENAIEISSKLAEETKKQKMSHGDITALVDLSVKIVHLFSEQRKEYAEPRFNFTESMISSMSNILRAEIKDAWEVLPKSHQTRAASKILKIVTVVGSHLSCIKKSEHKLQFTIAAENIGMQTFILSKKEETDKIVFPQKIKGAEINSSLIVPANLAWKRSASTCRDHDTGVGVLYNHVGDFLTDAHLSNSRIQVVTKVISFSMNNNSESFPLPKGKEVLIILRHNLHETYRHENLLCVFWNFSKPRYGQWDRSGCSRVTSNKTHIVCSCNHLTNFAVLMDVNDNVGVDNVLSVMTYVCCGMSSFSLVITLICFLSIRALHGRRSIITGNLCFCLLITNLLVLFGLDQTENKILCASVAGLIHFWILSAFCWMLVEGYHLYKMVVLVFERGHAIPVKNYYLFAYGIPLFVVGVSVGIRTDDYGGKTYCWLSSNNGLMWSFVGPACGIILVNIVVFILTLRSASSVRIKKEQTTVKKIKNWARGSMSVMCLLGLTWCLGLFYIEKKLWVFSYIFTVLNGLQGVFIFLFHILLNDKVNGVLHCRGNKKENWRRSFPQTSSHHLHSKLSTRTSVNSVGCISCNVPVETPTRLSNVMKTAQSSYKENGNIHKSKLRSRKHWNLETYRKEKATHTVSDHGRPNLPPHRHFKPRSQSFPEHQENGAFDFGITHINRNNLIRQIEKPC